MKLKVQAKLIKMLILSVNDEDKDRMCYITGKVAKDIIEKREKMGNENFRKFYKNYLLGSK